MFVLTAIVVIGLEYAWLNIDYHLFWNVTCYGTWIWICYVTNIAYMPIYIPLGKSLWIYMIAMVHNKVNIDDENLC